ncbi:MAG: hypothetical protein JST05_03795 [Acidobacteria bacterium]|nr:hypothetical protein [Acidobacteriota bacterium]
MSRTFPILISTLLLGGLLACSGTGGGSGSRVAVTVQAGFQKEVLNPSGGHTMTTLPARYCYVEFRDASTTNTIGVNGYLDGNGTGTFQVPSGSNVFAVVYADWAVPGATSSAPFMQGFTVNAPYGTAFASTTDWNVTSSSFVADGSGTLTVVAQDDTNRIAGAFNIADQGVTFALGMQGLLASGSTLPSVAMYWSTDPAHQNRAYPTAVLNGSNIVTVGGRALFQAGVFGDNTGAAYTEQDEWDDGTLGETYAHLVFANYSYKADGSSALSLLRTDTENVPFIPLATQSEPSMAFTTGFCDFLSAAFRGNPQILDSYRNGSGVLQVQNEDLSTPNNALGEFSRYGVAGSLWTIRQALGGNQTALQTLVNSATTSRPTLDGVGDYTGAPLGAYPTYLVGLRSDVGSTAAWTACQTAFGAWGVADPSATYFTGTSLWTLEAVPFTASGSLVVPATPAYPETCYAKNGAALYRFTQGSTGTRTLTLTPSGQDMELDLLGPNGPVAMSYSPNGGGTRTLSPKLSPGDYVIRVRVNPDSTLSRTAGTYTYNLALN